MNISSVIEPPNLLVFTWRSEFTGGRDTVVTLRLTEHEADETDLELTHELRTSDEAASDAEGWSQIVTRLEAYLEVQTATWVLTSRPRKTSTVHAPKWPPTRWPETSPERPARPSR